MKGFCSKETQVWLLGVIGVIIFLAGIFLVIDLITGIVLAIICWLIAGFLVKCRKKIRERPGKKKSYRKRR